MGYKVDILKELEQNRDSSKKKVDNVVKETQLLLECSESKEREALRIAGLDHEIRIVDSERGRELERENSETHYGGKVFTQTEIRDLCMKYDLRLLPSRMFSGKIDPVLGKKISDFVEKHQNEMGNSSSDFYIMAPGHSFNLENRKPKPPRNVDPVLLYKIPKKDEYVFIHKWGADFTVWRRLRGMFFESDGSMFWLGSTFYAFLIATIISLTSNFVPSVGSMFGMFGLTLLLSAALGLVTLLIFTSSGDARNVFTRETWNSKEKRRTY
jgi:hypothetical protein